MVKNVNQYNYKFIEKMLEAKKMEAEAISELFPEESRRHLHAAGEELKTALLKCVMASLKDADQSGSEAGTEASAKKTRKVDIQ